jgi:beta-glucosidase
MKSIFIITLLAFSVSAVSAQTDQNGSVRKPVLNAKPKYDEFFTPQMEVAVEAVLKQMTVEEKIKTLQGDIEGVAPPSRGSAAVKRLGVGAMIFYNGPRGMQTSKKSTLFPTGVAQAASFNPALVEKIGAAISNELLAAGWDVLEAPSINIIRDPLNGRNFEYFTEDPFLNSKLTAAFIIGGQRTGALNTAKHFIGNNKEQNRNEVNAVIGERALQEIYLPAFKAACDAGVLSIMTGANRVNGPHASDNPELIDVLKNQWGWPGFLYTDWNGVQTTQQAFEAGLDLSMPGKVNGPWTVAKLKPIVELNPENLEALNDKVRRLLRGAYFAGKLPGAPKKNIVTVDYEKHQKLALEAAIASMVLVKNENNILPITNKINKIAVIGPMADKKFSNETGGSSGVLGVPYDITALKGLKERFGNKITNIPFSINELYQNIGSPYVYHLDKDGNKVDGFLANYSGVNPVTNEKSNVINSTSDINFNWEMASPDRTLLSSDKFNAEWSGTLTPPVSGKYTIRIKGTQIVDLYLDGQLVSNKHFIQRLRESTMQLEGGKAYQIKLKFNKIGGDGSIQLAWITPNAEQELNTILDKSVEAAKAADIAIVVVGLDHNTESEGMDRLTMGLQDYQDQLIERVTAANPKTVVVLYGATPIAMPWLNKIHALVLPWYAGIENGHALATLLAGDHDFSGRMPITFPKKYEDSPAFPSRQTADKNITIQHNEGIFVGYRWYQEQKIEPLIPFGYGLSYSQYSYSKPIIKKEGNNVTVKLLVKNTGKTAGTEVVQLYIHDQKSSFPRPPKELKGFESIHLNAGQSQFVTFNLNESSFSYFNPDTHKWWLEPGIFDILIGESSTNVLQKAIVAF